MGRGVAVRVRPAPERTVILAIAGQKGGGGKSLIAILIAALAKTAGWRVLLVDADPQGSAITWGEVAAEQKRANQPMCVRMGDNLREQLPQAIDGFDLVIIDCPGAKSSARQLAALTVADFALLPVAPSTMDIWAIADSVRVVEDVKELRKRTRQPDLRAALVINKRTQSSESKVARDALSELSLPVMQTTIGQRVAYSEAIASGQGITNYQPDSVAAEEFSALFDELFAMVGAAHG